MNVRYEVYIADSGKIGPKLLIIGGIHGNEKCGANAIYKLKDSIKPKKGKITFIIANKKALNSNKRYIEEDLNRAFISQKQTLEKGIADELKKYLDEADAMLDLHSSPVSDNIPYAICQKHSLHIVKKLGINKVVTNIDEFHHGSTDEYMNLRGKVGICIECGLLGSYDCDIVAEKMIYKFCSAYKVIKPAEVDVESLLDIYNVVYMYKNINSAFTVNKKVKDFELIPGNSIIGHDGDIEVKYARDYYILFAVNAEKIGSECFLLTEKISEK